MNKTENNTLSVFYQLDSSYRFLVIFSSFLIKIDIKNFLFSIFCKTLLQALNFICMLLPLKIILFLSPSQEINGILSATFNSKENLIITLCFFFLFFLGLTKLITNLILKLLDEKVDKVANMSDKAIGYFRANKIRNKIRLCISCYASFFLISTYLFCSLFVYRELTIIIIISILFSALHFYLTKDKNFKSDIPKDCKASINFHSELIFFSSFSYILVSGLLKPQDVVFFNLVIGILIARQITALTSHVGKSLISLNRKDAFILELLDKDK